MDKHDRIQEIARQLGEMTGVIAVALSGSGASGYADTASDVDLCVYAKEPPPIAQRRTLALAYDPNPEIDNQVFGTGDEWGDPRIGLAVDLMFWTPIWIEQQLGRVLDQYLPAAGYSTCFWRTVQRSVPLIDPTGWFARLQATANQPYPEALRCSIIATNWPLLRGAHSSFLHQIEKAITRNDGVSVHHRSAALLASWFDVLFAVNRVPHPGEKRLIAVARVECTLYSPRFEEQISAFLFAVSPPWHDGRLIQAAHDLINELGHVAGFDD